MASFGLYLESVATPIVKRALSGIGIGVVTYLGLDVALQLVKDQVIANWGMMPAGVLTLMTLSGVTQGVGIILGAIAARYSMLQLSSLAKVQ